MDKAKSIMAYLACSNPRHPVPRFAKPQPPTTTSAWAWRGFQILTATRATSTQAGWATIELLVLGNSLGKLKLGTVLKHDIDYEVAQLKAIIKC
jgi:hypothetical protein